MEVLIECFEKCFASMYDCYPPKPMPPVHDCFIRKRRYHNGYFFLLPRTKCQISWRDLRVNVKKRALHFNEQFPSFFINSSNKHPLWTVGKAFCKLLRALPCDWTAAPSLCARQFMSTISLNPHSSLERLWYKVHFTSKKNRLIKMNSHQSLSWKEAALGFRASTLHAFHYVRRAGFATVCATLHCGHDTHRLLNRSQADCF